MSSLIEKIESSEYIYSTFTKWGLKKYICDVAYFTEEPLDDLCFVICSILDTNNGYYSKRDLGILLGFSMAYQNEGESTVVYYDNTEVGIFEDLLEKVQSEHLIRIENDAIFLTVLGRISVTERKHYSFYKGTQVLYEHQRIKTNTPIALMMFPFYEDMGIFSVLEGGIKYWPEDDDIERSIFPQPNQLIKRIERQSKEISNIYFAELRPYFDIDSAMVEIKLFLSDEEYIPIVMNKEKFAPQATNLILNELNADIREDLVLECLFQKLWDDQSSILNYQNLEPYIDLVDYEKLTMDSRTVWTDKDLLQLIIDRANSTCWSNISQYCDIAVICENLDKYEEQLNWPILTKRIDDRFLDRHFVDYPWDLEVLSEDYSRNIHVIEKLILQQKETEEEWNWEELENRLSDSFVLDHLDVVKVNLDKYTKDSNDVRDAIINNADKRWNWDKVEQEFALDFIYTNLSTIGASFTFSHLLERVFTNEEWEDRFASDTTFKSLLNNSSKNQGILSSIVLNDKNYSWTPTVIDTLEECGLIRWETTDYMKGFECNPYLHWTMDFFKRYYTKIKTKEGKEFVSQKIGDVLIIKSYPDFGWDWTALSSNTNLISDSNLYYSFGNNLNWSIVLDNQTDKALLQSIQGIDGMIKEDQEAWKKFSSIADIDYVVSTFKEKQYPWDWTVLTERLFKTKLRLENLGNKAFVDKWDWKYLSENVNTEYININLDKFKNYWVWDIVLPRILTDTNRFDYNYLDGIAAIISSITSSDNCATAWTAFTTQYSFVEIKKLLKDTARKKSYWWDMSYFCQHQDFNIYRDLDDCRNVIDWNVLSSSSSVDNSFRFNPKLGIKSRAWYDDVKKLLDDSRNNWNFKLLSKFSSLRDQEWFLDRYKDKLDWDYLSQSCKLFNESDKNILNSRIVKYKGFLNFILLSERTDVDLEWLLKAFPKEKYDYNKIVENGQWEITHHDVEERPDYNWNWQLLCSQNSFRPSAKFLMTFIDKPIEWNVLCHKDLGNTWNNEPLLLAIIKKNLANQIDWYLLSSHPDFPISRNLFVQIPVDDLNWDEISKHKGVFSILDLFEDYVQWQNISENISLNVKDVAFLEQYKDRLDWYYICRRSGFVFTNDILDQFSDYIDWSLASQSLDIVFTKELVEKYKNKWNWPALFSNKAFNNRMELRDRTTPEKDNIIRFIRQFPSDVKPKAYHFTHMANAVNIIKSMTLQSRDLAEGHFENSAGSNVTRTNKAHRFARFYFAPQSPTQFYNECLGIDSDNRKYYHRALGLGLPKCPLPVFFVFDIEELLMTMPEKCYYSTGNMQKDSSRFYQVTKDPSRLKAKDIFKRFGNKEEKQQEFLVEGEVDFSMIHTIDIYCFDAFQKEMLCQQLQGSPLLSRIKIGGDYLYGRNNKEVTFEEYNDELEIDTNYSDDYELRVNYQGDNTPNIVNKEKVIRQKGHDIYVSERVILKKDVPFEVYFEVKSPRVGSWLIYKNN